MSIYMHMRYINLYTCMHMHRDAYISIYTHVYICMYVTIYTYAIYKYIYMYTCVHRDLAFFVSWHIDVHSHLYPCLNIFAASHRKLKSAHPKSQQVQCHMSYIGVSHELYWATVTETALQISKAWVPSPFVISNEFFLLGFPNILF